MNLKLNIIILVLILLLKHVNSNGYDFEAKDFNGYFGIYKLGSEIKTCHKGTAKKKAVKIYDWTFDLPYHADYTTDKLLRLLVRVNHKYGKVYSVEVPKSNISEIYASITTFATKIGIPLKVVNMRCNKLKNCPITLTGLTSVNIKMVINLSEWPFRGERILKIELRTGGKNDLICFKLPVLF